MAREFSGLTVLSNWIMGVKLAFRDGKSLQACGLVIKRKGSQKKRGNRQAGRNRG